MKIRIQNLIRKFDSIITHYLIRCNRFVSCDQPGIWGHT